MATTLEPGFYRDADGDDPGICYVDEAGALWLVWTSEVIDDLPWPLEDEQAEWMTPFAGLDPADAAEYRRMVTEASGREGGRTRRRRPSLI